MLPSIVPANKHCWWFRYPYYCYATLWQNSCYDDLVVLQGGCCIGSLTGSCWREARFPAGSRFKSRSQQSRSHICHYTVRYNLFPSRCCYCCSSLYRVVCYLSRIQKAAQVRHIAVMYTCRHNAHQAIVIYLLLELKGSGLAYGM